MTDETTNLTASMVTAPHKCRLALLVRDDSVDVAVMPTAGDDGDGTAVFRHLPLTARTTSLTRAVEELVYDNPLLLCDFGRMDVLFDTARFLVVPQDRADDDRAEEMLETMYPDFAFEPVTSDVPGGAVIAAAVEADVERFAGRTFAEARRMHRLVPLVRYFGSRPRTSSGGRMYIHLTPGRVDVIAFKDGKLMTANTFSAPEETDALYFILASASNLGFDDGEDRMMLSGDPALREALLPQLRKYYPHAMPAIFPASMLCGSVGDEEPVDAPFELLALSLCE